MRLVTLRRSRARSLAAAKRGKVVLQVAEEEV
jgi:hypothetical protein